MTSPMKAGRMPTAKTPRQFARERFDCQRSLLRPESNGMPCAKRVAAVATIMKNEKKSVRNAPQ